MNSNSRIIKVFTKSSTIALIKKIIGVPPNENIEQVIKYLPALKKLLIEYVTGNSLDKINESIAGKSDTYLTKTRYFVIRLIPEISFAFGLLAMVIIEKSKQSGMEKGSLPWSLRALASCIREGFDDVEKLFFKRNRDILSRVEAHLEFRKQKG
jgi:hypothetical protein